MKNYLLVAILLMVSSVFAAYDLNDGRDIKFPTQQVLERISFATPVLGTASYILLNSTGDTNGAGKTITTFLNQPDYARLVVVTPSASTADVKAGNVVITGTNIYGKIITENLAFTDNQSGATTSTKAFKTITSIAFPAEDSPYTATWNVGVTDALGLNHCMTVAGDVAWATFNGVYESTRPTCVANATDVSKNVCDINSTLTGSAKVQIYYVQNFKCYN